MKKVFSSITALFIILLLVQACSKPKSDNPTPPSGTNNCASVNAHFAADVAPIISTSCAAQSSCHGSGSGNGPGELLTYAQIKASSASIRSAVESRTMPKTGSLSQAQINKISCWVSNGAQND